MPPEVGLGLAVLGLAGPRLGAAGSTRDEELGSDSSSSRWCRSMVSTSCSSPMPSADDTGVDKPRSRLPRTLACALSSAEPLPHPTGPLPRSAEPVSMRDCRCAAKGLAATGRLLTGALGPHCAEAPLPLRAWIGRSAWPDPKLRLNSREVPGGGGMAGGVPSTPR